MVLKKETAEGQTPKNKRCIGDISNGAGMGLACVCVCTSILPYCPCLFSGFIHLSAVVFPAALQLDKGPSGPVHHGQAEVHVFDRLILGEGPLLQGEKKRYLGTCANGDTLA